MKDQEEMLKKEEEDYTQSILALEKLLNKLKPSTSTSERSAIVALYTTDDDIPLRFSGKIGMLQLDFDRKFKTRFFRFYDIQTLDMLMEFQLFYGFDQNYRKLKKDTLYVMDFFHNGGIGFEFRTKEEAENMCIKVKSSSPKMKQFRELQKQKIQKQLEVKNSQTFFGKMKKRWHQFKGDQPEERMESKIIEVEKKRSISYNFENGQFDLNNIPPEWQEIFDAVGLKKKHLKNKQILECIFEETLIHQAKKAAQESPEKITHQQMTLIKEDNLELNRQSDVTSLKSSVMTCDFQNADGLEPPEPDFSHLPPPLNISTLPQPPPLTIVPPPLTLVPPPLDPPPLDSSSKKKKEEAPAPSRADLMAEIRNNKIHLKPVTTNEKKVEIDASAMNKQQRKDLAEVIRLKLKKRQIALSRREASDSDSD